MCGRYVSRTMAEMEHYWASVKCSSLLSCAAGCDRRTIVTSGRLDCAKFTKHSSTGINVALPKRGHELHQTLTDELRCFLPTHVLKCGSRNLNEGQRKLGRVWMDNDEAFDLLVPANGELVGE